MCVTINAVFPLILEIVLLCRDRLAYAVQSYFFAGFCEELIKYWTINRLRDSVMTSDWRSFVVYGICAGCGFAMAENILYSLSGGYATALVRAFTAVPFHCTTGCLLGIGVAKRRHLQHASPWWRGDIEYISQLFIYLICCF